MFSEKLCRLCMSRSNLLHSVLDDNLLQKIAICVSIMINPTDKRLPLDLCALCALKVKDFFEFRQNCLKVQQLLEQDVSDSEHSVQSLSQPSTVDIIKQEISASDGNHSEVNKFEVMIDEEERMGETHDIEDSVEEADQIIEQLDNIEDEDILVEEDLVEQDETLSDTEQTNSSEHVPEGNIKKTNPRDMNYEIQMIELIYNQNSSESAINEIEENGFEDEEGFEEHLEEKNEYQIHEKEQTKCSSLRSGSIKRKRHPFEQKPERDEKEIYRSLLQQCATCGKSVERNRMEGHRNRHLDVRPYVCSEMNCGLAFHCKISLRLHTKNRHGTEELHCDLCGKIYFSKKALYHHKKESHVEKQFACAECGLVFVSNARLNRHKVTHTDQREYKCPHCPKEFYRSNNLKVHIRSHTKEKPFNCSSCDKAFGYQRLLRDHMNRHHKGSFDV